MATTRKRKVGFLIAAFLLAILFVVGFPALVYDLSVSKIVSLDADWNVTFHGKTTHVESLRNYRTQFKNVKVMDSLVLEKQMPADLSEYSAMQVRLYQAAIEVFIDGREIYSYGKKTVEAGGMAGSGVYRIDLPGGWLGKTMRIRLWASNSMAFDILPDITLAPNHLHGLTYEDPEITPVFFVACFMAILGAILIVCGLGGLGFASYFLRLLLIGFFSLVLGVWTLCYTNDIQLISLNRELNSLIEYGLIYLSPCTVGLLFLAMRKDKLQGWRWIGLCVVLSILVLVFLVATFAQFFHLAPYVTFLKPFHVISLLGIVFLLLPGVAFSRKDGLSEKIFGAGFIFFCVLCVLELVLYILHGAVFGGVGRRHPVIPIGVLGFLFAMLISYAVYLQKAVADRAEKFVLSSLAYRDSLTGLYNRAKCEKIFDALNSTTSDYAIVSVDLDGLKKVNDNFGHGEGDLFLKTFANLLLKVFTGIGTPVRMGGDEFVVIIRQEHLNDLDAALQNLQELEKVESEELPFPLEGSYGVALQSEVHSNADAVYRAADSRMYAMKQKSKLSRQT
ncbi:MAG: GGDEF domain-containing protein [Fibrobacter sp.]|nr:GGDEF domain-containing protein [Fibrobacter sp.]